MNMKQAKTIYNNPKGYTKDELIECLEILNEAAQPVELSDIQFEAILDVHRRLGGLTAQRTIKHYIACGTSNSPPFWHT